MPLLGSFSLICANGVVGNSLMCGGGSNTCAKHARRLASFAASILSFDKVIMQS